MLFREPEAIHLDMKHKTDIIDVPSNKLKDAANSIYGGRT